MSEKSRLNLTIRTVKVIEFLATPGWHSYGSLAVEIGATEKTARRWIRAFERAGMCVEFERESGYASRFRLVLTERSRRAAHYIRVATSAL